MLIFGENREKPIITTRDEYIEPISLHSIALICDGCKYFAVSENLYDLPERKCKKSKIETGEAKKGRGSSKGPMIKEVYPIHNLSVKPVLKAKFQ